MKPSDIAAMTSKWEEFRDSVENPIEVRSTSRRRIRDVGDEVDEVARGGIAAWSDFRDEVETPFDNTVVNRRARDVSVALANELDAQIKAYEAAGVAREALAAETAAGEIRAFQDAFAAAEFGIPDFLSSAGDGFGAILAADLDFSVLDTQLADARGRVAGLFGKPFAPVIEDEDFEAYLVRVAELRAEALAGQLDLLQLEDQLTEEQFGFVVGLFEDLGPEAAREFVGQFADTIGTEDFDPIVQQIEDSIGGAALESKINGVLAQAQLRDVPVDVTLNESELQALGAATIGLDAALALDTEALVALLEEDYNLRIVADVDDSQVDALENRQINLEGVLSIGNLDAFLANLQAEFEAGIDFSFIPGAGAAAGGAFDEGGVQFMRDGGFIANRPGPGVPFRFGGRRFRAGEDGRGPENVEFGPQGMAVVGAYHDGALSVERLASTGTLDRMEPVLRQRWGLDSEPSTQVIVMDDSATVRELASVKSELAAMAGQLAAMDKKTGLIAESNEITAKAALNSMKKQRTTTKNRGKTL